MIAFGRIHIIEDEQEKLQTARMLGNRYNPNQDEALQREIEGGLSLRYCCWLYSVAASGHGSA